MRKGQDNFRTFALEAEVDENITPIRKVIKDTRGTLESVTTHQMRKDSDERSFLVKMNESHETVSIEAFEALDAHIRS